MWPIVPKPMNIRVRVPENAPRMQSFFVRVNSMLSGGGKERVVIVGPFSPDHNRAQKSEGSKVYKRDFQEL